MSSWPPASWQTGEPTEEMPCVFRQAFCRKITVCRTTHVGVTDAVEQRQTLVRLLSQGVSGFLVLRSFQVHTFFFFYFRQTALIFHKRMKNKHLLTGQSRLGANALDWDEYFIIMPLWCRLSLLHWFNKLFLPQKEDIKSLQFVLRWLSIWSYLPAKQKKTVLIKQSYWEGLTVFFRAIDELEIILCYITFFCSATWRVHKVSNTCRSCSNDPLLSCELMLPLHFSGGKLFQKIWKVSVLFTCDFWLSHVNCAQKTHQRARDLLTESLSYGVNLKNAS